MSAKFHWLDPLEYQTATANHRGSLTPFLPLPDTEYPHERNMTNQTQIKRHSRVSRQPFDAEKSEPALCCSAELQEHPSIRAAAQ